MPDVRVQLPSIEKMIFICWSMRGMAVYALALAWYREVGKESAPGALLTNVVQVDAM